MENCADQILEEFQDFQESHQEIPIASPLLVNETQQLLDQEKDCEDLFKSNPEKTTIENEVFIAARIRQNERKGETISCEYRSAAELFEEDFSIFVDNFAAQGDF